MELLAGCLAGMIALHGYNGEGRVADGHLSHAARPSLVSRLNMFHRILHIGPRGGSILYDSFSWGTARGHAHKKSEFKRVINPYSKAGQPGRTE